MDKNFNDLTRQLAAAPANAQARNEVFEAIYEELVKLARAELARHRRGATLNTRALINETYLRLFKDGAEASFENRKHFFASAARAMRHVVIDYARRKLADRRGGGAQALNIDDEVIAVESQAEQLLAMDTALQSLGNLDPRLAEVVELRFFAGLSVAQIAEILAVSVATIKRDTRVARAFLSKELTLAADH
jgi:RNA polymerase sigma factor (TIGR02999 family)